MKVLVTGNAGFIGFHTAKRLLERGDEVVGFDSVNDYYDPSLKEDRLAILAETARQTGAPYTFIRANLADQSAVKTCFAEHRFDRVIHLAAQAGVRFSLENPHAYVEGNIVAFTNVLEACRHAQVGHLTYASTSSVHGANTSMRFREDEPADHPLQFYAATKRANELMAHSYIRTGQHCGPWRLALRDVLALFAKIRLTKLWGGNIAGVTQFEPFQRRAWRQVRALSGARTHRKRRGRQGKTQAGGRVPEELRRDRRSQVSHL